VGCQPAQPSFETVLVMTKTILTTLGVLTLSIPAQAQAQSLAQRLGTFEVRRPVDPMTDGPRTYATTTSKTSFPSGLTGSLGWQCLGRQSLSVLFYWGKYFNAGAGPARVPVRVRFHPDAAEEWEEWSLQPSHKAARMPLSMIVDFTKKALESQTVSVQVKDPVDGEQATITFDLSGLSTALDFVMEDCQ